MASSSIEEEFEHLITCSICFENFKGCDPRILGCVHSFCLQCLDKMYKTNIALDPSNQGKIKCPTCSEETVLPEGSVFKLKKYFVAEQVADAIAKISQSSPKNSEDWGHCTKCKSKKDAVIVCFQCTHSMCECCAVKHNRHGGNQTHIIIDVNRSNIMALVCTIHDAFAEDYCITCNIIACGSCHDSNHAGHKFGSFCLQNQCLKDAIVNVEDQYQLQKDRETNIIIAEQYTSDQIDEHVDQLVNDIVDQSQKLKSQLRKSTVDSIDKLQFNGRELDARKRQLQITYAPVDGITGLSLNDADKVEEASLKGVPPYQPVTFVANTDIMTLGLLNPDKLLISRGKSQCLWTKKISVRSIGFLQNGNIIIVISSNSKANLALYDKSGQSLPIPLDNKALLDLGNVRYLALHQTTLVVTGKISFTVIYLGTSPWKCVTHKLGFEPWVVTFTPDGHVILSEYKWIVSGKLAKYTTSGLLCWEKDDVKCDHMAVTTDGRIIISHGSSPNLRMYVSYNGTNLGNMSLEGTRGNMGRFYGLCFDKNNKIYMASRDYNVVGMLNSDGKYVKNVVTGQYIYCMSLYKDRLLAVGNYGTHGMFGLYSFDG